MTRIRPRMVVLFLTLAMAWPVVGANAGPQQEFSKRTVIQPGAGMYGRTQCTVGFLLKDPSGAIYAVTEGNCAPNGMDQDRVGTYTPYVGSRTWKPGTGPVVERYERKHRPFG